MSAIPEQKEYLSLVDLNAEYGIAFEHPQWRRRFDSSYEAAKTTGEQHFTIAVPIRIESFSHLLFYIKLKFNTADFKLMQNRPETLAVKRSAIDRFALLLRDGIREKPGDFLDYIQLAERLKGNPAFEKYKDLAQEMGHLMIYFKDRYVEVIKRQIEKRQSRDTTDESSVKLPDYILILGRVFRTKDLEHLLCKNDRQYPRMVFCVKEGDAVANIIDIYSKVRTSEFAIPLPDDNLSGESEEEVLDVSNHTQRPIRDALKSGYNLWLLRAAQAKDMEEKPQEYFPIEFTLKTVTGTQQEKFKINVPASQCAYCFEPVTGKTLFYVKKRMLLDDISPNISLGWKLSHNMEVTKAQPMYNIRQIKPLIIAKAKGKADNIEMARIAEVVDFLIREGLVPATFAHKLAESSNLTIEGKKFDLNSDIAFEKVKSSHRFFVSDEALDKLISVARKMVKTHGVSGIMAKYQRSGSDNSRVVFAR